MKLAEQHKVIQLRREGMPYHDLVQRVGVAKSTVWRWLKRQGLVETQPQQLTALRRAAQRKGSAAVRTRYLAQTQQVLTRSRKEISSISQREAWLIGAALYWAEGTKQKPHNISQRVVFTNSDPRMVEVFVYWLTAICGVQMSRLSFELCIHESADSEAARRFWADTLRLPLGRFRVRLKRHKLVPHRRNVRESYVGLVRVVVQQSAMFNRSIQGWVDGIIQGIGESANGKPSDFGSEYPGSIPGSPVFGDFGNRTGNRTEVSIVERDVSGDGETRRTR